MSWLSVIKNDVVAAFKGTASTTAAAVTAGAAQVAPTVVSQLEADLQGVVDGFLTAAVGKVPVVGAAVTPVAVEAVNDILTFGEAHAVAYIQSLFAKAKTSVAAPAPAPSAAPAAPAA